MKELVPLIPTINWIDNKVHILDQTKLPLSEEYIETKDYKVVCDAIYRLSIRGAPAIGVAGAYAWVLLSRNISTEIRADFIEQFLAQSQKIEKTRPTAINLKWAVKQMRDFVLQSNKEKREHS